MSISVVTGASGGIGAEICKILARTGSGLILVDRTAESARALADELHASFPGSVRKVVAMDLADHADIARACAGIAAEFSAIDAVFNNAGVLTEKLTFSKAGNELHFEVNTLAPLQIADYLRPSLASARGVIVNTTAGISLNVKTIDWETLRRPTSFSKLFGPYNTSKAALNAITLALGTEFHGDGILVRAADPGPTKTRLTKGAGTPLWMRAFYALLPGPEKSARKIVDAADRARWSGHSGIMISGGVEKPLPVAIANPAFAMDLLKRCRELVASQ